MLEPNKFVNLQAVANPHIFPGIVTLQLKNPIGCPTDVRNIIQVEKSVWDSLSQVQRHLYITEYNIMG